MNVRTFSALFAGLVVAAGACTIQTDDDDDDDGPGRGGSNSGGSNSGGANSGGANSGGSDEGGTSGAAAGEGGAVSEGGANDGGANEGGANQGGATQVDGGSGGIGEGGAGQVVGASCDGAEVAPNDTREEATAYNLGDIYRGCLEDADDLDFYEFTTPSGGDGGYVTVSVTDVGSSGNVDLSIWSAADNGQFLETHAASQGASVYAYFNAEPGSSFRFSVQPFTGPSSPTAYRLQAVFHPILDLHEPNDLRTTATPITLGQEVVAYQFAGFKNSTPTPDTAWFDWYKITLAVGDVSATMSIVSADINGEITLMDSAGAQVEQVYSVTRGSSPTLDYTVETAGTYYVRTSYFTAPSMSGETVDVPQYLTEPYTLTVTQ